MTPAATNGAERMTARDPFVAEPHPPPAKQSPLTEESLLVIQSPLIGESLSIIQPPSANQLPSAIRPLFDMQALSTERRLHGSQPPPTTIACLSVSWALILVCSASPLSTGATPTYLPQTSRTCYGDRPISHTTSSKEYFKPRFGCRPVVTAATVECLDRNADVRWRLTEDIRTTTLSAALRRVGLDLTVPSYPLSCGTPQGPQFLLLQKVLSQYTRATKLSLAAFVELDRCQTPGDYRPNKNMCPQLIETVCAGYPQLGRLREIAVECIRVHVCDSLGPQTHRPSTHGSARTRLNVLRKNIRKQQDAWRCLALNRDILALWSEIFISPFGVVNKSDGDPEQCERTIHDLPYPKGASINDHTNHGTIPRPVYMHCDAIAKEIIRFSEAYPGSAVELMAVDVTSAFRNLSIHSGSVHWFAGVIEEDDALVWRWTGSTGLYEVVGGAISYVHGSHTNTVNQSEVFNYHWVDGHVYVAAAIGSNCTDMERSLRFAMTAVLGAGAVNEDKFTGWASTQKVLGLNLD